MEVFSFASAKGAYPEIAAKIEDKELRLGNLQRLVDVTGIEPATSSIPWMRSTIYGDSYNSITIHIMCYLQGDDVYCDLLKLVGLW